MTTYISGKFRLNFISYLLDHKKKAKRKIHVYKLFETGKMRNKKIELKGGRLSFSKWEYFDTN